MSYAPGPGVVHDAAGGRREATRATTGAGDRPVEGRSRAGGSRAPGGRRSTKCSPVERRLSEGRNVRSRSATGAGSSIEINGPAPRTIGDPARAGRGGQWL